MTNQRWIERVGRNLVNQGLPKGYVRRVVGELRDHHDELATAQTEIRDESPGVIRLGNPSRLAGAIAGEFRRQHFSGRHPLASFLAAPVLLMLALWALLPLSLVGLGWLCEDLFGIQLSDAIVQHRQRAQTILTVWQTLIVFGTPIVVALLVCRWAKRSAVSRGWLIAACAVIALLAFAIQVQIELPTAPGNGRLAIGFGLTSGVLRMLLPLLAATWVMNRAAARWPDPSRQVEPAPELRRAA